MSLVTGFKRTRTKDDGLAGITPSSICIGSAPLDVFTKFVGERGAGMAAEFESAG
jgi:hypothetical protein